MRYLLFFAFSIISLSLFSQSSYVPLGSNTYHLVDRYDIKYGKILPIPHTASKPYKKSVIANYAETLNFSNLKGEHPVMDFNIDYLLKDNPEWLDSVETNGQPFLRYFYKQPSAMLSFQSKTFSGFLNPVIGVYFGSENVDSDEGQSFRFNNTRGLELRFDIKNKVSFYTYLTDNQLRYTSYVNEERNERFVDLKGNETSLQHIPGNGFYKNYKEDGVDFFDARGYVSFNVLEHIDFQFGYDKHFLGNGYRSLFLSDNSSAYTFLKMQTNIWKISYQSIFAELNNQKERGADNLIPKKYAAFHHLNFHVNDWFDFGVFEGVIMTRSDHFELHYLTPIIFYRAIEQALGSPDNSLIGIDYKVNVMERFSIYGQFIIDEFNFEHIRARDGWWGNKYAIQQGLKYIDVGGIKNLDMQIEYNMSRPFMYTHSTPGSSAIANYTHYNQELAHPLGANFREFIFITRYQPRPKWQLTLEVFSAVVGTDTSGTNWGSNVFLTSNGFNAEKEFDNFVGQGIAQRISYLNLFATYQPWHNIFIDAEIGYRSVSSDFDEQDDTDIWFGIGARMNMISRKQRF